VSVIAGYWDDQLASLVSAVKSWQARAQAAGASVNIDTTGKSGAAPTSSGTSTKPAATGGSDAVKAAVASLTSTGQGAQTAAAAGASAYQAQLQLQAKGVSSVTPDPNLMALSQAATAAGQKALDAAKAGGAIASGADASSWLAQSQSIADAASGAASAVSNAAQVAQMQVQAMQSAPAAAPTGGGGGSFGGGGGGGGGGDFGGSDGGGLSDGDIDWGDGGGGGGGGLSDDDMLVEQGGGGDALDPPDPLNPGYLTSGAPDPNNSDGGETMVGSDNNYFVGAYALAATHKPRGTGYQVFGIGDFEFDPDADDYYPLIGVDTVPAAVSYVDQPTVLAVQAALKDKGFDPGPLDGIFGPKTSKAIKAAQKAAGRGQTGVVDYGVLAMLGVRAPASTPTTTTAGRSASAAAQDADAVAAKAQTPAQVTQAAQAVEAANAVALPPPPPEVQTKVAQASAAARTAKSPAEVAVAARQVQDAAKAVVSATSFWGSPLWAGAPVRRWQGAVGVGAGLAVAFGFVFLARR
jgi:hypothetical protein